MEPGEYKNTHKKNAYFIEDKRKKSSGEKAIAAILKDGKVNYIQEHCFLKCKNPKTNKVLRFDFYLPNYQTCIEYDGTQHFYKNNKGKESLKEIQYRDKLKEEGCKNNNIVLVRFSHKDKEIDHSLVYKRLLKAGIKISL